jgi:hypothetical protein
MHQSLRFIARRLNTAQNVLGILMPIIRSLWTAVAAYGLPLERGGSSFVDRDRSGQPDRSRPTTLLPPRFNGKPKATTAVVELLMMGKRMPETCCAVFKRRVINLRDWCIWLVWFIWMSIDMSIVNWKSCVVSQLDNLRFCLGIASRKVTETLVGMVDICPEFWTRDVSNTK